MLMMVMPMVMNMIEILKTDKDDDVEENFTNVTLKFKKNDDVDYENKNEYDKKIEPDHDDKESGTDGNMEKCEIDQETCDNPKEKKLLKASDNKDDNSANDAANKSHD